MDLAQNQTGPTVNEKPKAHHVTNPGHVTTAKMQSQNSRFDSRFRIAFITKMNLDPNLKLHLRFNISRDDWVQVLPTAGYMFARKCITMAYQAGRNNSITGHHQMLN